MGDKVLELPRIDGEMWRRAEVVGIAFLVPKAAPPGLGLIMRNTDAAFAIFDGWRRVLGDADEADLLRVAIIEGDIPGQPTGYTVTIGIDLDSLQTVLSSGPLDGVSADPWAMGPWIRRMNTPPGGSPHLQLFKELYAARPVYTLVPVVDRGKGWEPNYDRLVLKRKLLLRSVRDIGPDDPDRPVLLAN